MPIKVKCPNAECGKVLAVKDEFAGNRAKCPGCGGTIQIPNGSPAAAIAPAQPAPTRRPAPPPPIEDEGFAAAAPPAARRRAAAPPAEVGFDEGGGEWAGGPAPKSGLVTTVAIINFVLGGLALLCGAIGLLFGSLFTGASAALASNAPMLTMQLPQGPGGMPKGIEMPKINMEDFNKKMEEANKALSKGKGRVTVSGAFAFLGTLMILLSILNILWGGAAIAGGIGLLQRRNWGRLLTLILAGVAGVEGLVYIAPIFMGAPITTVVLNVFLYLAYAGFVFFVLLKPDVRREFA